MRCRVLRVGAVLGAAGCCLGAIPAVPALGASSPRSTPFQVVLSTADLSDALTPMPELAFGGAPVGHRLMIHVSDSVRYQRVSGFGAAMTDTSAWLIHHELSPAARDGLIREPAKPTRDCSTFPSHNTSRARIRFAVVWRRQSIRYSLAPGAAVTFTWK